MFNEREMALGAALRPLPSRSVLLTATNFIEHAALLQCLSQPRRNLLLRLPQLPRSLRSPHQSSQLVHLQRSRQLVGNEDQRHLALQLVHRCRKALAGLAIQIGSGFIMS